MNNGTSLFIIACIQYTSRYYTKQRTLKNGTDS